MQRPKARQFTERESKWNIFIKFLPLELKESYKRVGRKIARARRGGGHQENMAF